MHLYVVLLVKGKLASAQLQEVGGREFSGLGLIHFLENYPAYPMNLRVKYINNEENEHFEWYHDCSPTKGRELSGLMIMQNPTLADAKLWGTVHTEMMQWCDAIEKDKKATLVSKLFVGVECGNKGMVPGEFAFFTATGVTEAFCEGVRGGDIFSKHELDSVHIRMVKSHKGNDSKCNIELRWALTDDKVERGLSEEKYDVPKYRYNLKLHTPKGAASKGRDLAACLATATTNIEVWKDIMSLDAIKKSLDEEDKFTYCLLSRLKSTYEGTFLKNKPKRDEWLKGVVQNTAKVQPAKLFYFNLPENPWSYLEADVPRRAKSFREALPPTFNSYESYCVGVLQAYDFDIVPKYLMTMIKVTKGEVEVQDSKEVPFPDQFAIVARIGKTEEVRYKYVKPRDVKESYHDVWKRAADVGTAVRNTTVANELKRKIASLPKIRTPSSWRPTNRPKTEQDKDSGEAAQFHDEKAEPKMKDMLNKKHAFVDTRFTLARDTREHAGEEQQPVDAAVSRTDVTHRTGSNTLLGVVSMQEAVQKELIRLFTDCTDSSEKELLRNTLLSMRATWEHMAESREHVGEEQQPVDADVSRTDVTHRTGSNTLLGVVSMQEEVQKELIRLFTACTDSSEKELLRNTLLSMRATWEHMAESRQHAGEEQQPVDADVSRTDVTHRTGSNTLLGVVSMQEAVQKELIRLFTDCTDSAEKELLRNTLLSMRATWEHMAESREHVGEEQQPVDADVSRTDVTHRTGSNTLLGVVSMQEEVQKELIRLFTDCTDSAEKELLRNTLLSMRATWEHMAESRQHAGEEQQPVDADVSRTDVTHRTGSNTLLGVVSMQEAVQKELIRLFTDCTDSAEKELLRNTLLSMRATWEHMAESREHVGEEQQPVDADVSRTDVTHRTGSNTLLGVVSMQEEVQKELIRLFTDCTDSAEKELLRNTLLSMRATWEHMAESREHVGEEQQPVDAAVSRTDVTHRTGSNTLLGVVSMQEAVQKELIRLFTDCTDSAEKELLRNTLLSMRATWEHMAECMVESRQHAGEE